jgi:DNA-binding MarR family transcriptional regulator
MLVDRLEHAGWVHRRPHPTDRCYTLLELSPKAAQASPAELDRYHQAIGAVPARHQSIIAGFLNQAAAAASRRLEISPPDPSVESVRPVMERRFRR